MEATVDGIVLIVAVELTRAETQKQIIHNTTLSGGETVEFHAEAYQVKFYSTKILHQHHHIIESECIASAILRQSIIYQSRP